jgi:hypothetical protein
MNKQLLIKVGFVFTAVVSGFVFSACGSSSAPLPPKELTAEEKKAQEGREALAAKKAEYTIVPTKEQLAKEAYRNKKMLFYRADPDSKEGKEAWVNYFPSEVSKEANEKLEFKLAGNPDEVGTIALLPKCKEVKAGQYGSTAWAYKEQCELILIDTELAAVVYRKIFEGEPEQIKTIKEGETSVTAKVDQMKIVDFLDRLPRKDDTAPAKTDTSPAKTGKK